MVAPLLLATKRRWSWRSFAASCYVVATAIVTFVSGAASAQASDPDGDETGASAKPQNPSDPDGEKAAALAKFKRAQELYRAGEFSKAVALLLELRRVRREPALLYNLARAYEGLGDLRSARDAYRRYLDEKPDARDRGAIRQRIRTLDDQLLELKKPAPPPVVVEVPAETDGVPAIPIAIAAVGLTALGVGTALGIVAGDLRDDAETEPSQTGAKAIYDDAGSFATGSNVLFVAGGVLAAAGLTWLIVEVATEGNSTTIAVTPFGVHGTF